MVSAVFAADAIARLTGIPGVAAVTASTWRNQYDHGTKNAQMAQSPSYCWAALRVPCCATGAPCGTSTRWYRQTPRQSGLPLSEAAAEIVPPLNQTMRIARSGVPGRCLLNCRSTCLYNEETVREWYGKKRQWPGGSLLEKVGTVVHQPACQWYWRSGMSNYVVPGEQPFIPTLPKRKSTASPVNSSPPGAL